VGSQQTHLQSSTGTRLSSSFFPPTASLPRNLVRNQQLLDEAGQRTWALNYQHKSDLSAERVERPPAKEGEWSRKARVHAREEVAAKCGEFLLRNCYVARKCRARKKVLVSDLLRKAGLFSTNNAKLLYEIEQVILELNDLSVMAAEPATQQSCCFDLSHRRVSCASISGAE
jgi:hypothetical protein